MSTSDGSTTEYTGKDVSYYLVRIAIPKRLEPYDAECEDIIEALGMTFAEGCAFKAIWRKCAARTLGIAKAGYKGGLYDAEKAEYYGARMVAAELRAATIGQQNMIDPEDVEIASSIDDSSERMQAIGRDAEPVDDYGNIQIGDLVSVIGIGGFSDCTGLSVGDIVEVTSVDNDESLKTVSGGSWGSIGCNYKFHSRPSA